MNVLTKTLAALALATGLALAPAVPAMAQTAAANPPAAEKALPSEADIKASVQSLEVPADLLARIQEPAKKMALAIAEINKLLEGNLAEISNAEQRFDQMIAAVRESAAAGDKDGAFVKHLNGLIRQARLESAAARDDGDEAAAKAFEEFVTQYKAGRDQAIKVKDDSFRVIRQLEKQKRFFVRGLKLRQFKLAAANMKKGIELMAGFQKQLEQVQGALPKPRGEAQ